MNVTSTVAGGLSVDQHLVARASRLSQYTWTIGITLAVMVANLVLILVYAPAASTASRLAIALSVVSVTAFGALAGRAALQEIVTINDDLIEMLPGTRYTNYLANLPSALFIRLTVILICLSGLVQFYALFAA